MFRCAITGKLSEPKEKGEKIVTKTRKKEYFSVNNITGEKVKIGEGWEIVEEKLVLTTI